MLCLTCLNIRKASYRLYYSWTTIIRTSAVAVAAAYLLSGCSKEPQHNTGASGAVSVPSAVPGQQGQSSGEALFRQFCSNCHPDGGNVSDRDRTLHGSVLRRNHITAPEDIIKIMRNPISRMIRFDVETISDKDAQVIAEYVLTTFR